MKQILEESKIEIGNTLNQWPWQPAWNDEDLGQSALTEAHGDCTRGLCSPGMGKGDDFQCVISEHCWANRVKKDKP